MINIRAIIQLERDVIQYILRCYHELGNIQRQRQIHIGARLRMNGHLLIVSC